VQGEHSDPTQIDESERGALPSPGLLCFLDIATPTRKVVEIPHSSSGLPIFKSEDGSGISTISTAWIKLDANQPGGHTRESACAIREHLLEAFEGGYHALVILVSCDPVEVEKERVRDLIPFVGKPGKLLVKIA